MGDYEAAPEGCYRKLPVEYQYCLETKVGKPKRIEYAAKSAALALIHSSDQTHLLLENTIPLEEIIEIFKKVELNSMEKAEDHHSGLMPYFMIKTEDCDNMNEKEFYHKFYTSMAEKILFAECFQDNERYQDMAKWRKYNSDEQCMDWIMEYSSKGDEEMAKYVSSIANDCGNSFRTLTNEKVLATILEFTKSYVREGIIDEDKGNFMLIAQTHFNHDYRLELSQPFVYNALMHAAEKGFKFARGLVEKLDRRLSFEGAFMAGLIVDIAAKINDAPYANHIVNESKEHLEHRVAELIRQNNVDYIVSAPDIFVEALQRGEYFSDMNECNTSLEDMETLGKYTEEVVKPLRLKRECSDYIYVCKDLFFHFSRESEKAAIYVGNPRTLAHFSPMLGYYGNSFAMFSPEKESPERHLILEFENEDLKKIVNNGIRNNWYGQIPEETPLTFRHSKNSLGDEKVLWELV